MNTGIFPPVCRPLYPISIETEHIARIEKKISDQRKNACTLNMCLLQSALISTQCKQ